MSSLRVARSQRGFIQYVVLGVLLLLAAGAIALLQHKHAALNDLTASLTGTGGVLQVTASVASGFTGPVKTMEVFRDNTLVPKAPAPR